MPENPPEAVTSGRPERVLSLVIPCYDEAETLPALIRRVEESFGPHLDTEVVLVDNGSTDETSRIMASLRGHPTIRTARVEVNQGYGFGILEGLRAARGEYLGWTHADMQADPADALHALELVRAKRPASIYVKGRRYGRPLQDVVFTVGMSFFETALLRAPLWDINAQPNIFHRSFYESIVADAPHDFSLDLYFYHEARRMGVPIHRFPVRFGERAHGVSHWNVNWSAKRRFIMRTVEFSLELRRRMGRAPTT
jgi:glycosyltransferase involved in cell wall biosynthesis